MQALHERIDELSQELVEADDKWERARIRRQLAKLQREAGKLPKLETSEEPKVYLKLRKKPHKNSQRGKANRSLQVSDRDRVSEKITPATTIEQTHYWSEFRRMHFAELREYIDNSLKGLSEPNSNKSPNSKEEFLALWEILRKKIGPPQFPRFAPSKQLRSLLEQREMLVESLVAACRNPAASKRSLKKLQRKLKLVE